MPALEINSTSNGDQGNLELKGSIDEDNNLESIPIPEPEQIHINLEAVNRINSCGVRDWVLWMKNLDSAGKSITLKNCPPTILDQVNMIDNFIPGSAKIESFFVPFCCVECEKTKNVHVKTVDIRSISDLPSEEDFKCKYCEGEVEMDIIGQEFFDFLKLD